MTSENFLKKILSKKILKNIYYVNHFLKKYILINFYDIGYDSNIANLIKNKLEIETECNSKYLEVFRGIRSQLTNLLDGNSFSKLKVLNILGFIFWISEKNKINIFLR